MTKYYAGIGSRSVPDNMFQLCFELSKKLAKDGWTCRSGGAKGCDTAFQQGSSKFEIYYPSKTYLTDKREKLSIPIDKWEQAEEIAASHHPAWRNLSEYVKSLHTRNVFQLLGLEQQSSSFVVCWTPDGAENRSSTTKKTGGTGQAIRVADSLGIPVFNLNKHTSLERIKEWLKKT